MTRTSDFDPSDLLSGFASVAAGTSSGRVVLLNAMRDPSGDHAGAEPPAQFQHRAGVGQRSHHGPHVVDPAPVLGDQVAQRRLVAPGGALPPGGEVRQVPASCRPSGDHRWLKSRVPDVNRRGGSAPLAGTSQMLVS